MHFERIPSEERCKQFLYKTKELLKVKINGEWSNNEVRERFTKASEKWLDEAVKELCYQEKFIESWLFLNEYMRCLALNKYVLLYNSGMGIFDNIKNSISDFNPFELLNIIPSFISILDNYKEM